VLVQPVVFRDEAAIMAVRSCAHGGIKPHVHVHMNYPSINGMQGVRGSNPLSYTRHNASAGFPFRAVYQQITSSVP